MLTLREDDRAWLLELQGEGQWFVVGNKMNCLFGSESRGRSNGWWWSKWEATHHHLPSQCQQLWTTTALALSPSLLLIILHAAPPTTPLVTTQHHHCCPPPDWQGDIRPVQPKAQIKQYLGDWAGIKGKGWRAGSPLAMENDWGRAAEEESCKLAEAGGWGEGGTAKG